MILDEPILRFIRSRLSRRHLVLLSILVKAQPHGLTKDGLIKACRQYPEMSRSVVDSHIMALYVPGLIDMTPEGPATVYKINEENGFRMGDILAQDGTLTDDGELR